MSTSRIEEAVPVFEQFRGIPMHPLLVHAAVVFVPLQILATFAYILVARLRSKIEWLVLTLAILGPVAALLAKLSGDAFRRRLINRHIATPTLLSNIANHSHYGNIALYCTIGLTVLTILFVVLTRNRMRAGPPANSSGAAAVGVVLTVAVLGAGLVTGYYVVRAGDAGAHMAWSGY
jgi:uncharacterized membrane protein